MASNAVAKPVGKFSDLKPVWERCRDAMDGHHAVNNAGTKYLPKLSGMESRPNSYEKYRKQALFFEASGRTRQAYIGLLMRRDPEFNFPSSLDAFMEDATGDGTSMLDLAKEAAEEELTVSRFGLLVERPDMSENENMTVAQAEAMGNKVFVTRYWAEDILEVKTENRAGKTVKTRVRLLETYIDEEAEFELVEKERIRVLDLDEDGYYRQRVFVPRDGEKKGEEADWIEDEDLRRWPLMNNQKITEIPFYMTGGPEYRTPWMTGLVETNLTHYIKYADYSRGVAWTTRPQPYVSGQNKDNLEGEFIMGGGDIWLFPDPTAKVGMLEYKGTGLTAAEHDLEDLKNTMAVLGARMLVQEQKAAETAEAHAMKRQGENSALGVVADNVGGLLTKVMFFAGQWSGAGEQNPEDYEASLNKDFLPSEMSTEDMVKLWSLVQAGGLTKDDYFYNLKQGERLDPTKDQEEREAEIETQPAMPGIGEPAPQE